MLFIQTQINRRGWNNGNWRQAGSGRETWASTPTHCKQLNLFFSCQSDRDGGIERFAHLTKDIIIIIIRINCSFNSTATHHDNAGYHSYTIIKFQFICSCVVDTDEETTTENSIANATRSASMPGNMPTLWFSLIWKYFMEGANNSICCRFGRFFLTLKTRLKRQTESFSSVVIVVVFNNDSKKSTMKKKFPSHHNMCAKSKTTCVCVLREFDEDSETTR